MLDVMIGHVVDVGGFGEKRGTVGKIDAHHQ
jgi:hypothetical protein